MIQNALHTLAYASGPVAIEVVKHFDPTELSSVLWHLSRVSGSQSHSSFARLLSSSLTGGRWFNAPHSIMEPDRTRSLCVDWAAVVTVSSIPVMSGGGGVTLAVLFAMINSSHWHPHIIMKKCKLLKYFTLVPDDSQP